MNSPCQKKVMMLTTLVKKRVKKAKNKSWNSRRNHHPSLNDKNN